MAVFRQNGGLNIKFSHRGPPRHILHWNYLNGVFCVKKNPSRGLYCSLFEIPDKKRKKSWSPKKQPKSRLWGAEILNRPWQNFACRVPSIKIIKHAKFGENLLGVFGLAIHRILGFSADLRRRHYSTLALPCEFVIFSVCFFNDKWMACMTFRHMDRYNGVSAYKAACGLHLPCIIRCIWQPQVVKPNAHWRRWQMRRTSLGRNASWIFCSNVHSLYRVAQQLQICNWYSPLFPLCLRSCVYCCYQWMVNKTNI